MLRQSLLGVEVLLLTVVGCGNPSQEDLDALERDFDRYEQFVKDNPTAPNFDYVIGLTPDGTDTVLLSQSKIELQDGIQEHTIVQSPIGTHVNVTMIIRDSVTKSRLEEAMLIEAVRARQRGYVYCEVPDTVTISAIPARDSEDIYAFLDWDLGERYVFNYFRQ